ncbi:Protein of unknown function [Gryllus bimaculatus]|nr:Protein of unknown function [Gryllus bimaculatus]
MGECGVREYKARGERRWIEGRRTMWDDGGKMIRPVQGGHPGEFIVPVFPPLPFKTPRGTTGIYLTSDLSNGKTKFGKVLQSISPLWNASAAEVIVTTRRLIQQQPTALRRVRTPPHSGNAASAGNQDVPSVYDDPAQWPRSARGILVLFIYITRLASDEIFQLPIKTIINNLIISTITILIIKPTHPLRITSCPGSNIHVKDPDAAAKTKTNKKRQKRTKHGLFFNIFGEFRRGLIPVHRFTAHSPARVGALGSFGWEISSVFPSRLSCFTAGGWPHGNAAMGQLRPRLRRAYNYTVELLLPGRDCNDEG